MKRVVITVEVREGAHDRKNAAGTWEVVLNHELSEELAAGAALDLFQRESGLKQLDDYRVKLFDANTRRPLHQNGWFVRGSAGSGKIRRVHETLHEHAHHDYAEHGLPSMQSS